MKQHFTVSESV